MIIVILVTNVAQRAASKINVRIPNSAIKHASRIQTARQHNVTIIMDAVARDTVAPFKFARV